MCENFSTFSKLPTCSKGCFLIDFSRTKRRWSQKKI